jgi:hypothetical protein
MILLAALTLLAVAVRITGPRHRRRWFASLLSRLSGGERRRPSHSLHRVTGLDRVPGAHWRLPC